ncbi:MULTISPECIES: aminoglycoside N(3)-acetyltransferase [unclassified Haladaptatus]|uniref:aminoglycoside N(3)-acetyltransferase n=1 Tax=unclassified Haladaptatus TaxID=2622732 RepID=UPI0023E7ACD1|nr:MULTISPECIES: AAC(3) family N-acetyltransferase [unclassified Haladaptatus]
MTEQDAIEQVDAPATVSSLAADFRDLGLSAGDTVIVHSSLSSLGWVCGDAPAVVDALMDVLTETGTLVMPSFTSQYSNPEFWSQPPVPDDWVEVIKDLRPAYRPESTPTRGMGAIGECFRNYAGVVRSQHPITSFAAWGTGAADLVADHELAYGLGEGSPLAKLYDRDAKVLLLGVGHANNTSIHLAEYRADLDQEVLTERVPVERDGERVFVEFEDIETDTDDFEEVGAAFEREHGITEGTVGAATVKLVDQPALVDFAVEWFETNR